MSEKISRILKISGKIFLWILVFAAAALPAVYINAIYGWMLLLFMAFLLLSSIVSLFIIRGKIRIESGSHELIVRLRGEEAEVGLSLINESFLFCPAADANIYISDIFGDYDARRKSRFIISGKDIVTFGFTGDMSHIGIYGIGIDEITLHDMTGFFRVRVPVKGQLSACIMPRIRHMEELSITDDITSQSSSNTRVIMAGGMDYAGVREYTLGDPMKQIHWKLSAHSNEYMTKLQESSRQQEYSVFLDFASIKYDEREWLLDVNDALIETALSLINDLSERGLGYRLLYPDRKRNIRCVIPIGRENDPEMISEFMPICDDPDKTFPDACAMLAEETKGQNRGTNVLVVTSRVNSDLVMEMINIFNQKRYPELYLIVPRAWSSRQAEDYAAPIKVLNDYDIPYFVLRTDLNASVPTTESGVGN